MVVRGHPPAGRERSARIAARYASLAERYDGREVALDWLRRAAIERLELAPGDCVLDVACGSGASLELLEERVGPEGRIIGIDVSPEMLARARDRFPPPHWSNVELICASVEQAPLAALSADAALISLAHDVLRSPQAVRNVVAGLRPGARVAVAGAKWGPWWRPDVNLRTLRIAHRYASSYRGWRRPWALLESQLSELEVESIPPGLRFVAWGRTAGARPTPA